MKNIYIEKVHKESYVAPEVAVSGGVALAFFVPVRFDRDLEAGYELRFQFGGNYYNAERGRRVSTDVYPVGDKRKLITTTLPLENGKLYRFEVTI